MRCITSKCNSPAMIIPRHQHQVVKSIIKRLCSIQYLHHRALERLSNFLSMAFKLFIIVALSGWYKYLKWRLNSEDNTTRAVFLAALESYNYSVQSPILLAHDTLKLTDKVLILISNSAKNLIFRDTKRSSLQYTRTYIYNEF